MSEATPLEKRERRCRRLLRAYPPGYRRARGDEMLTTLMDADDARGHSSTWESVTLVLRGLRLRLTATSVPVRVMAILAAVIVGVLGAAGGAIAGWQAAAELPDEDEAGRIAATAVPGVAAGESHDVLFGWAGYVDESLLYLGGDDYSAGFREFALEHDEAEQGLLRQANRDLAAAGWDVESIIAERIGEKFTATRDGVFVTVETERDADEPGSTSVRVERAQPMAVPVATVAGLALGALVGWTIIVWLEQLMAHWGGVRKSILAGPLTMVALFLGLPTLFNLYVLVRSFMDLPKPEPVWIGYIWGPPGLLTLLAMAAMAYGVVKVLVAMLRRPRPARATVTG